MQLTLWTDQADRSAVRRLPRRTPPEVAQPPGGELALEKLEQRAAHYVDAAYADNTRRAYRKDWAAFERCCAGAGLCTLPASGPAVDQALESMKTVRAQRGEVSGRIRISVPSTAVPLVLARLLPRFVERFPKCRSSTRRRHLTFCTMTASASARLQR